MCTEFISKFKILDTGYLMEILNVYKIHMCCASREKKSSQSTCDIKNKQKIENTIDTRMVLSCILVVSFDSGESRVILCKMYSYRAHDSRMTASVYSPRMKWSQMLFLDE